MQSPATIYARFAQLALALAVLGGSACKAAQPGTSPNQAASKSAPAGAIDPTEVRFGSAIAAAVHRADMLRRAVETDDAIEVFSKVISTNPKVDEAYLGRAMAYEDAEKWDLAEKDLVRAARGGSFVALSAREELARLYYIQRKYALAKQEFTQVLALKPDSPSKDYLSESLIYRANCELRLNEPGAAVTDATAAIHLLKLNAIRMPEVLHVRAKGYVMLRDNKKALADYDSLIDANQSMYAPVAVGGRISAATMSLERAKLYDQMGYPELAQRDRERAKLLGRDDFDLVPFNVKNVGATRK